jgi:DNA excision repair protein ERCC-2
LIDVIYRSDQLLCSAPTGVGKSISALCACLADREEGEKIVILTRTKSQAKIFLQEVARIAEHVGQPFLTFQLRSKQEICPVFEAGESNYEEFLQLCKLKQDCPHRQRFRENKDLAPLAREIALKKKYLNYQTMIKEILEYGCPYLVLQELLRFSDIVVASYLYLLNPFLRGIFLRRLDKTIGDLLLIVDESHNLQNLDLMGKQLSRRTLDLASEELNYDFSNVYSIFDGEDQGLDIMKLMSPDEIRFLLDRGIEVLERRLLKGKKVSYTFRVASFLDAAVRMRGDDNWMFFRKEGRLYLKPIFPSELIEPLREAKKLLFMSGTLDPIEGYKILYGMEGAEELSLPKIFPRENCSYFGIKKGLNSSLKSREEEGEELWKRYAGIITDIAEVTPMTTLAFFPSYEVMEEVRKHVNAVAEPGDSRGAERFWKKVRNRRKKTVFVVAGGKLSEGVEYTIEDGGRKESVVKTVIAAGFPFPVPDFELNIKGMLYEERFGYGKAFLLLSVLPMVNKVIQGIGRAIRSERDRAAVVFLDDRLEYLRYFPEEVRHEIQICELEDLKEEVEWFHH